MFKYCIVLYIQIMKDVQEAEMRWLLKEIERENYSYLFTWLHLHMTTGSTDQRPWCHYRISRYTYVPGSSRQSIHKSARQDKAEATLGKTRDERVRQGSFRQDKAFLGMKAEISASHFHTLIAQISLFITLQALSAPQIQPRYLN